MLFHDIFAHHPKEREAIIDQDRSVTYGEFQDLVERWAAYFEALGVKKGDRVGLVSKNCLEFIVTYFAVIKAGGVIVPINFQLVPREIAYIVKDTAMKLLVVKEALPLAEPLQELSAPSLMQITFDELHHARAGICARVPYGNRSIDHHLHIGNNGQTQRGHAQSREPLRQCP